MALTTAGNPVAAPPSRTATAKKLETMRGLMNRCLVDNDKEATLANMLEETATGLNEQQQILVTEAFNFWVEWHFSKAMRERDADKHRRSPTPHDFKTHEKVSQEIQAHIDREAKVKFYNLLLPNGIKWGDATGTMHGHYASVLGKAHEEISRVVGDRVVREVLSEAELHTIVKRAHTP